VPINASISSVDEKDLDPKWQESIPICQAQGDTWYRENRTLLLKVPSSIMPISFNYLVNMQHPESMLVKLKAITQLMPDKRIEEILKNYKSS
jgi:RES domain-containing protein